MMLHSARRYFHDGNRLPNLEALKNIYQVVAQQLLNSRERYVKKHHNRQPSVSPVRAGDLILIKDHTAKSFQPQYKGNYRVVKVHGNNVEIRDYRGNISMVHVTDVKKITLTEQVADEYEQLGKEGRFSKKCIPRGYIPDFDWTMIHQDQDQPIKPIKQEDPTETLQPQLHPRRLRDPQVVALDPKPSSNRPPMSRVHRNTIRPQRIYWNAIQQKYRSTQWKLHENTTP